MSAAAEINDLIGRPFEDGARGPEAFDCWGLVAWVGARLHGYSLPDWDAVASETDKVAAIARAEAESERWREIDEPAEGAVCLMSGQGRLHIGIIEPGGPELGLLHCAEGGGVQFHDLAQFRRFCRMRFFEWAG